MPVLSSRGSMLKLKNKIIKYAHTLSIDLIGFTTADRFNGLENILNERKKKNYVSEFEEENFELRIDPRKTLKSARSDSCNWTIVL